MEGGEPGIAVAVMVCISFQSKVVGGGVEGGATWVCGMGAGANAIEVGEGISLGASTGARDRCRSRRANEVGEGFMFSSWYSTWSPSVSKVESLAPFDVVDATGVGSTGSS
ncbi:BQ5605_C002g01766 [Microbotryum silenes-dioicae]|uniref:BQ5605_C002g01766 protein n=1 Tax=Microbotryum silenes-dioicae TaxID=796604 RepID=A0A2X0LZP9_9BASI|nr:BQ5605_C002g01766 [Microbotryum silenes-dioicae]